MLQRNRTLTGCGTCRSRHVKCDESRPECQKCQQQGLTCLGYERQLIWAKDALRDCPQDPDRVFRRPLFSSNYPSMIGDRRANVNPYASGGARADDANDCR